MYLFTQRLGKEDAFTLIETLLAIGLSAILATSAAPVFIDASRQAQLSSEDTVGGHVQTGITLQQMQNFGTSGIAQFPATLDEAPIGVIANGNNPFFNHVLQFPITSGWRKESEFAYRAPTDRLFVYDPNKGTFIAQAESTTTNPNNLGNIVYQYAGIVFYDSGAIVDTTSQLAYVPSLSGENVALTLANGAKINTHEDGSALITLADGETLKVADIHKPAFFKLSPEIQNGNEHAYSYLWVDNGQASEGTHNTVWHKKEYQATKDGGTFHYEYDLKGDYSGGSLKKDYGFIYRSDYASDHPQVSKGSWKKKANGDYEGVMEHSYEYESNAKSGYNHPEAKYRYAFQQEGKTKGNSETNYSYDKTREIYQSKQKGKHEYSIDRDASNGPWKTDVSYDYDGDTAYDKKKGHYQSEFNYRYRDGKDLTYRYQYDEKDKTYEWSVTDNKSGKVTKQTNKNKK